MAQPHRRRHPESRRPAGEFRPAGLIQPDPVPADARLRLLRRWASLFRCQEGSPIPADPYTLLFPIYRARSLSRERFQRHYLDVHVPIAARLPGLEIYSTFVNLEPELPGAPLRPDALAVMGYRSEQAFEAATRSAAYAEAVADNVGLVGRSEAFRVGSGDGFAERRPGV